MSDPILTLPIHIQIAAASGYVAYMAANTGIRGHHTVTETAFGSAAFGLVATAVLAASPSSSNLTVTGSLALALTVFAGLVWRKIGCRLWLSLLQQLEVTRSDDSPSAWLSISDDTENYFTQIAVQTDDGCWLMCNDTAKFKMSPNGPCIIGPNGDIALYLTHEKKAGEKDAREITTALDASGHRITYIPASRIRRVNFRRRSKLQAYP